MIAGERLATLKELETWYSYEDALKYADSANEVRLMIKLQSGVTPSSAMDQSIDAMSLVRDEDPRSKR